MNIRQLMFFGLCGTAVSVNLVNAELRDEPGQGPAESGVNDFPPPFDDMSELQEPWIYVQIPHFGMAPLQLVLDEGSPENLAWLDIGQPLDMYMPVAVLAPSPNMNNGAITVLMLPERCLGDFTGDGRVNMHDVAPFTAAYLNLDPIADLTGDTQVDVRDQIFFLHLATTGCVDGW